MKKAIMYIVCVDKKEDPQTDGTIRETYYAYPDKIESNSCQNLLVRFRSAGIVCVHPCSTKAESIAIAEEWNNDYRRNGTFMYDRVS